MAPKVDRKFKVKANRTTTSSSTPSLVDKPVAEEIHVDPTTVVDPIGDDDNVDPTVTPSLSLCAMMETFMTIQAAQG
nr:hypothetical protein CFP56_62380 [Quercus suber]